VLFVPRKVLKIKGQEYFSCRPDFGYGDTALRPENLACCAANVAGCEVLLDSDALIRIACRPRTQHFAVRSAANARRLGE
jgi:hypothetical protein